MINVAAASHAMREIEEALSTHPAVAEAASRRWGPPTEIKSPGRQMLRRPQVSLTNIPPKKHVPPWLATSRRPSSPNSAPSLRPAFLGVVPQASPRPAPGKSSAAPSRPSPRDADPGDLSTLEDPHASTTSARPTL